MPIDLKTKRIIITGGAGFLGRQIVRLLHERGVKDSNIFTLT
jgi:nucleoside-diphosphate-sugar epimerase